jgi:hypothetical protein
MHVVRLALFTAAVLAFGVYSPYRWTHYLTQGCTWRARGYMDIIGARYASDRATEARCWADKGLKSPAGLVIAVQAKWPSAATGAAQ